jgi:HAD superfamily hydrolase (TIGR01549 family)
MPVGIIFDVDGTLIDSVDQHAQAWQRAFADYGHDIAFADIRQQIGKGGDQLMPVFLPPDELARIGSELEEHRGRIFKEHYLPQVKAFSQVRALFERILDRGQLIALASSAKADELEVYKKLAQIEDLIAAETSKDDAERSKPHPDIFAAALERLKLPAESVIVVGDTPYDAQAAGKLAIRSVGMLCGGFPADQLIEAGCVALYDDPSDLLRGYDGSPLADASTAIGIAVAPAVEIT